LFVKIFSDEKERESLFFHNINIKTMIIEYMYVSPGWLPGIKEGYHNINSKPIIIGKRFQLAYIILAKANFLITRSKSTFV